jgi:hypothetical protein
MGPMSNYETVLYISYTLHTHSLRVILCNIFMCLHFTATGHVWNFPLVASCCHSKSFGFLIFELGPVCTFEVVWVVLCL